MDSELGFQLDMGNLSFPRQKRVQHLVFCLYTVVRLLALSFGFLRFSSGLSNSFVHLHLAGFWYAVNQSLSWWSSCLSPRCAAAEDLIQFGLTACFLINGQTTSFCL